MSKPKPCTECWVEAQRQEAVDGPPAVDGFPAIWAVCPMLHDATVLPEGAGNPFDRKPLTPNGPRHTV